MASLEEKRAVARRLASKGVAGSISDRIGLRFYDAPADTASREIVNESLAYEIACQCDRIDGQFRSAKTSDPTEDFRWRWFGHGIKVTARSGCSDCSFDHSLEVTREWPQPVNISKKSRTSAQVRTDARNA
jgi:hypothetical protein